MPCKVLAQGVYLLALGKQHAVKAHDPESLANNAWSCLRHWLMDRTLWVKRSDPQLHAVQQLLCTPYTSSLSSRSCTQSMHRELVVLHSVQICFFSHQCDPLHSENVFVSPLLVSSVQLFCVCVCVCERERERERERVAFMLYKPNTQYLYNSPLPGSWNFFTVLHLWTN